VPANECEMSASSSDCETSFDAEHARHQRPPAVFGGHDLGSSLFTVMVLAGQDDSGAAEVVQYIGRNSRHILE